MSRSTFGTGAIVLTLLSTAAVGRAEAASKAADDSASTVGEVIVTALKTSESLQKAPAAISVVSGEELARRQVTDIRALSAFLPSFKTNVESTATQFFLRGVGKQVDASRIPEAVAMTVDGVAIPQLASGIPLFDVHSIEALPGPQGTLYGSSAIGGVVNVTTNRPGPTAETSLLVEAGDYRTLRVTLVQNMPLSPEWSIRAGYDGSYHGAYNTNGTHTNNMTAFRLSSLYNTADGHFSFFLSGSYADNKFKASPTVPFLNKPGYGLDGNAYQIPANDPATANFYRPNGAPLDVGRIDQNIETLAGHVDWMPADDITVSYIGGYLHRGNPEPAKNVVAGLLSIKSSKINAINNEIRISNANGSRFRWMAGVYQSYVHNHETLVFGPNLSGWDYTTKWQTYAVYAQGAYSFTDQTRLTVGLRESRDSLKVPDGQVFFPIPAAGFARGVIPISFDKAWDRFNWKVGVEQDIGHSSMLYGAVQTGFNPGTFNGNAPNPAREVKPQSMLGYTAGIKNRFLDSRLTLNLEGFLYDYKDQIITAPNLATGVSTLLNAPKSRIYGVQLDSNFVVTPNTKIHASVGYLNATFREFIAGNARGQPVNYAGYALSFSPKLTAAFGLGHTFDLGEKGTIEANVDTYVSSSYQFTYAHAAGFKQGSYTKTDASIMYSPPNAGWAMGVWAKNLENDAVAVAPGEVPGRAYPGVVYVDPPRTYGVRFSTKFNP